MAKYNSAELRKMLTYYESWLSLISVSDLSGIVLLIIFLAHYIMVRHPEYKDNDEYLTGERTVLKETKDNILYSICILRNIIIHRQTDKDVTNVINSIRNGLFEFSNYSYDLTIQNGLRKLLYNIDIFNSFGDTLVSWFDLGDAESEYKVHNPIIPNLFDIMNPKG